MGKGAPDEAIELDQLVLEVDSVDSSQHEHDLRQRQTHSEDLEGEGGALEYLALSPPLTDVLS